MSTKISIFQGFLKDHVTGVMMLKIQLCIAGINYILKYIQIDKLFWIVLMLVLIKNCINKVSWETENSYLKQTYTHIYVYVYNVYIYILIYIYKTTFFLTFQVTFLLFPGFHLSFESQFFQRVPSLYKCVSIEHSVERSSCLKPSLINVIYDLSDPCVCPLCASCAAHANHRSSGRLCSRGRFGIGSGVWPSHCRWAAALTLWG